MTDAELDALIDADSTYQEIDAAIDRATLAAKVSGRTFDTRAKSLQSYEDAKTREDELRMLVRRLIHAAGYALNRELRAKCARLRKENSQIAAFLSGETSKERDALIKTEAALAAAQALLSECAEHWASQRNVPPDSLAGRVRAAIAARKP